VKHFGFSPLIIILLVITIVGIGGLSLYTDSLNGKVGRYLPVQEKGDGGLQEALVGCPENTSWNLFNNPNYPYTFCYPKTWTVNINESTGDLLIECTTCQKSENVNFAQIETTTKMTLEEFIVKMGENSKIFYNLRTKFAGEDAVRYTLGGGPSGGGTFVGTFINYKNVSYIAGYNYPEPKYYLSKLNDFASPNPDFLKTFKFVR
jgi:hypothetical protein